MVPKEPKGGRATGTSFKGAFLYYTHDKREEGENVRLSSGRVEWMEYRNLATDDPHLASTIMAATAKSQNDLKRQAGASLAGNKSDKTVYHYSLGWNPSEKDGLTKAEMLRAADESLRALGAEGNQAALIAHNDTAHPHVHVIINRVHPETGKMLDLWNSQKTLSKWAMAYEQERGQVFCDKRVENWNERAKDKTVFAEKDNAYHKHDQAQSLGHANDNDATKIKADQSRKDAELAGFGKKMHSRHSNEWKLYSQRYHAGKEQIKGRHKNGKTPYQQATADVKAQFKPLRSHLGKQQWHETKDFERREKRLMGKLENAIAAVRYAKALGRDDSKGFMSSAFNFIISSKARAASLQKLHAAQWRDINAGQRAEVGAAVKQAKIDQQASLKAHRASLGSDRQVLKDKQAAERADLQRKWGKRKIERNRAFEILRKRESLKKEAKATERPSRGQQRAEFNRAARVGRKRKGRVRKRRVDD